MNGSSRPSIDVTGRRSYPRKICFYCMLGGEWRPPTSSEPPRADDRSALAPAERRDEGRDRDIGEQARQAARSSDFTVAGELLDGISSDEVRESSTLDVSMLAADAKDFSSAANFAGRLSPNLRQRALLHIVRVRVEVGDLDEAIKTAADLADGTFRDRATRILSLAEARVDVEAGKRRAWAIRDGRLRDRAMIDIDAARLRGAVRRRRG